MQLLTCVGDPIDGLLYLALYCLLQTGESGTSQIAEDDPLPLLEHLLRDAEVHDDAYLKVLPDIYRVLNSIVSQLSCISASLYCLEIMLDRSTQLQIQLGMTEDWKLKPPIQYPPQFSSGAVTEAEVIATSTKS
jgi:hypothetical protein